MKKSSIKDVATSVQHRLGNTMKQSGRPYMEILQHFAMERFLYRLSTSLYKDQFVLKGGYMLLALRAPISRPTMDIDLLGKHKKSIDEMVLVFREVCGQPVEDDGVLFNPDSVRGTRIMEGNEIEGVRIECQGQLGTTHLFIYVDISFNDEIHPEPIQLEIPSALGFSPVKVLGYTKESIIAEKLEAIARHGELNTRMKDFFDIWMLAQNYDFDGDSLSKAIQKTFLSRKRDLSEKITAFTLVFAQDDARQRQWASFIKKRFLHPAPKKFSELMASVRTFLAPLLSALIRESEQKGRWQASNGSWVKS